MQRPEGFNATQAQPNASTMPEKKPEVDIRYKQNSELSESIMLPSPSQSYGSNLQMNADISVQEQLEQKTREN